MTKTQIRNIITKTHFYLLGFALLNFTLKSTLEISLNYRLTYSITLLIYASGIILFFWGFKPFKKIGVYFSFYFITPILSLLFWLLGGIFFAISTSTVLYPIYPNKIKAENEKIVVYSKYQGFMGMCCPYELTEKKYWLLEKKKMEINLFDKIDFDKVSIKSTNEKTELKINYLEINPIKETIKTTDTIWFVLVY